MNIENLNISWLVDYLRTWGISTLTNVQQLAIQAGVAVGQSMIVSAPTSSGKTLVGEVAALSALRDGIRVIYLVSHKALADQKYLDFVSRFGEQSPRPIASVGLSTGDRDEGNVDARLMVATYEKALGLILSGQLKPANALVIADELQILGDVTRGPDIEALCAVFRQRGIRQFVALTATVENPGDLAGWMSCTLVQSAHRDVPLHQEIWYSNQVYRTTFGQAEGKIVNLGKTPGKDTLSVVRQLLELGQGPVLTFTESRREASDYAHTFAHTQTRSGDGIAIAEQLELFSEPTESSERLKENAEKRVAFHTADLSPQERQVIEAGFIDSKFEACFATSTLAAGVNFPFRTVVFPKLTFEWGDRAGSHLTRSDYRNMSGRAGRLGMHPDGLAVLLPRNEVELAHANKLVLPDNDRLSSQLVRLSLRKTILALAASGLVNNLPEVVEFFKNTLYWFQTLEKNPTKLSELEAKSSKAIKWLIDNELLTDAGGCLRATSLGKGAALSGLLPTTAVQFAAMIHQHNAALENSFDEYIAGLIHAACASSEYYSDRPSRFFPWPSVNHNSVTFLATRKLLVALDRADARLAQCAHAMILYVEGVAERKIAHATNVTSGATHRLAVDIAWILDGLHKISCVPDVGCPQSVSNRIALLARRVRWGAPAEALDVIRVAERHGVPGFGRQRAMALIAQGIATLHDVLATTKDRLVQLLRSDHRAQSLLDAATNMIGHSPSRLVATHERIADELGIRRLVDACNRELGVEYERAIAELLKVENTWEVMVLDDGTRQNAPDLLIRLGEYQLLLECKTCSKSPPLIKKEEAWAVLQKAAGYDKSMKRVTLGKPTFDETSKSKVAAAHDITLVSHDIFVEGVLRVHAGTLSPQDFLNWLGTPGFAELERLGGTPTFVV